MVCVVTLLLAEIILRCCFFSIGALWEYWEPEAAVVFEWYRNEAEKRRFTIVFSGDSTASLSFIPSAIPEDLLPAAGAFNMSCPGNSPYAFELLTLPLFRPPRLSPRRLIVSFSPSAFFESRNGLESEDSILSSSKGRRERGEWVLGDWIAMTRFRSALPFWRHWCGTDRVNIKPAHSGAMPWNPPGFQRVRFNHNPNRSSGIDRQRMAVIERLIDIAESRGIQLVLVIPPRFEPTEAWMELESEYIRSLEEITEGRKVTVADGRGMIAMDKAWFKDSFHLNHRGARKFTEKLCRELPAP